MTAIPARTPWQCEPISPNRRRETFDGSQVRHDRHSGGLNPTFELAIDLPRFEDVNVEFRRIVAAGGRPVIEPRDEDWGMRSSMVADPEGNLIEIGSWNKGSAGESKA
jgi:uncharacterized glyoxalase superfamily protein PhnB